MWNPNYSSSF